MNVRRALHLQILHHQQPRSPHNLDSPMGGRSAGWNKQSVTRDQGINAPVNFDFQAALKHVPDMSLFAPIRVPVGSLKLHQAKLPPPLAIDFEADARPALLPL